MKHIESLFEIVIFHKVCPEILNTVRIKYHDATDDFADCITEVLYGTELSISGKDFL